MSTPCVCCSRTLCAFWRPQIRLFHNSPMWFEKKTKKKYDFKTIQNLNAWKKETQIMFGPVITKAAESKTQMKKKTPKMSNILKSDKSESSDSLSLLGKTEKSVDDSRKSKVLVKKSSSSSIEKNSIDIPKISPIPPHSSNSSEIQSFTDTVPGHTDISQGLDSASVKGGRQRLEPSAFWKSPKVANPSDSFKTEHDGNSQTSFSPIKQFPFLVDENSELKLGNLKSEIDQLGLRFVPSVKSILNRTMPDLNRFFLNRWREKMVRELGEEGFKQHMADTINRGTNFHDSLLEYLGGRPLGDLEILAENQGHWASLEPVLRDVHGISGLEMRVSHPHLAYRGILDCLALYRDRLCVIDWKTSKKPRPDLKATYDAPLQVAAYLGALNAGTDSREKFGSVQHGVLVVAYGDGSPAHVHPMDPGLCLDYWSQWTQRLTTFYLMLQSNSLPADQ